MKTIYLANPYGFSEQQRRLLIPELVGELEALGLEVWEPFARNNQVDFSKPGWAYMVGQADLRDVRDSDATFAVVNGTPPDAGVSISHTFQDQVEIPVRLPKISIRALYPNYSPEEYRSLYEKERYRWAKENGLCVNCRREPHRLESLHCELCREIGLEVYRRSKNKMYYWAKENGFCTNCKKEPPRENRTTCAACADKISETARAKRARKHEQPGEQDL